MAPAGQAKPPVNPERPLPRRWLPFDVETAAASTQADWRGMSGAGVVLDDGRLIGIVVTAESGHGQRRLYLVPLADALSAAPGLAQQLEDVAGRTQIVEIREAPLYRDTCEIDALGGDGQPELIENVAELEVFGVKPADVPGEPTYLNYVSRDADGELRTALREAIDARRMLLVVGGSAAGKSRSTAEAVRELLPQHRFIRPRPEKLAEVCNLPLGDLGPAVVWLDDVQQHADQALRDTLKRLLGAGLVVIGTIRRAELEVLARPGEVRNPAGQALTDEKLVHRINWRIEWSEEEQARLAEHVTDADLLEAVTRGGTSLGAYVVAGPLLVRRLDDARADEDHPWRYALVRTVLDWYRTGTAQPISSDVALRLLGTSLGDGTPEQDEIEDALAWAATAVIGEGRKTRRSLIIRISSGSAYRDRRTIDAHIRANAEALLVNDYLIDHEQRRPFGAIRDPVWRAALELSTDDSRLNIATVAYYEHEHIIALDALGPLAAAGNINAMNNLGLLLKDSDPDSARRWWEQAAAGGHLDAMVNLGLLLEEISPDATYRWWEKAAAAGHVGAMFHLGVLLEDDDRAAALDWLERAAAAGHADAMFGLWILLKASAPDTARDWLEQAAAARQARAMFDLGVLIQDSDPAAALDLMEQSAMAGHVEAMFGLGVLMDSDRDAARHWYE
ncbi:MAG: tetratricopeptide repeat protein, partial [Solirubrobacteraceae bacterium]